jgi:hypothetical protein
MKSKDSNASPERNDFKGLQKWLEYFDTFWGGKMKKLEKLLNDKSKKNIS